jgi:hypothetical protein
MCEVLPRALSTALRAQAGMTFASKSNPPMVSVNPKISGRYSFVFGVNMAASIHRKKDHSDHVEARTSSGRDRNHKNGDW